MSLPFFITNFPFTIELWLKLLCYLSNFSRRHITHLVEIKFVLSAPPSLMFSLKKLLIKALIKYKLANFHILSLILKVQLTRIFFEKFDFEVWSFFCLQTCTFKMKSPNLDQDITRQIRRQIQTWANWMQRWWISYEIFALISSKYLDLSLE